MGKPVIYYHLTPIVMNQEKTSIGIDVSKKTLDIGIVSSSKKTHKKIKNELSGYKEMLSLINSLDLPSETIIIIEATGGYHYGVVYFLLEQGFSNVKVINPSIAKAFAKMSNLRGTKTDKIDSILLANLGKIKDLPSYRESKTDIKKKYLVTTLIGLRKHLRETRQRKNAFEFQAKVIDMKEAISPLNKVITCLEKEIEKVEKKLCDYTKEDVQIISSIDGISEKGAALISVQLGEITRFQNCKQIVAFTGLDPKVEESGTSVKKKGSISKKGNPILRETLFQSAWFVYMQAVKGKGDTIFVNLVERLKEKNKHYYQVLCAIAHKLIGIIFALLKKKEKYVKNYHFSLTSV
jgi:transposase